MTFATAPRRVAIVGAGLAGATCARLLADAGLSVSVFDKSRGVGGRLATRRASWQSEAGADHLARLARFDHGAPGFGARSPEFLAFVEQAARDGLLARWVPPLAPAGYAPLDDAALWVPVPDMPALCRALLGQLPLHTGWPVQALHRGDRGWRLLGEDGAVAEGFDAVIVAIPPQQAAPLLQPLKADWAERAQRIPMQPGWVLMAVTDAPEPEPGWALAWPRSGPLASIVRNDAKPGRERLPGLAHWVVHASAAWSQTHLFTPPAAVQATLQEAAAGWIGRGLRWHHAAVHRWRYASVPRAAPAAGRCWWDGASGLGVCGDALGGAGAEGAHASARALAALVMQPGPGSQARAPGNPLSLAPTPRSE